MSPRSTHQLLLAGLVALAAGCAAPPRPPLLRLRAEPRQHIGPHEPLHLRLAPILSGERAEIRFTGRCRRGGETPRQLTWKRELQLPPSTRIALVLSDSDLHHFGRGAGCRGTWGVTVYPSAAPPGVPLDGHTEPVEFTVGSSPPALRAKAAAWLARLPLQVDATGHAPSESLPPLLTLRSPQGDTLGTLWRAEGFAADEPEDMLPPPGRDDTRVLLRTPEGGSGFRGLQVGPRGVRYETVNEPFQHRAVFGWLIVLGCALGLGRSARPLSPAHHRPIPTHEAILLPVGASTLATSLPLASPRALAALLGLGLSAALWTTFRTPHRRAGLIARSAAVTCLAVLSTLCYAGRFEFAAFPKPSGALPALPTARATWWAVATVLPLLAASIVPPERRTVSATIARGTIVLTAAALLNAGGQGSPVAVGLWTAWAVGALLSTSAARWTGWLAALVVVPLVDGLPLPGGIEATAVVSLLVLFSARSPRLPRSPRTHWEWIAA